MSNLMLQEEVLQAVASDYITKVTNKEAAKMLDEFVQTSRTRHDEMYKYVEEHI